MLHRVAVTSFSLTTQHPPFLLYVQNAIKKINQTNYNLISHLNGLSLYVQVTILRFTVLYQTFINLLFG